MTDVENWPHNWFGVWSEYGANYSKCPSAMQFVLPDVSANYKKDMLRNYLINAPIVASTSRANFPNPFTGEQFGGSISFRTDEKWLWLDDLADYIDDYGLAIPRSFLTDIEAANYVPPSDVSDTELEALEWPPAGN